MQHLVVSLISFPPPVSVSASLEACCCTQLELQLDLHGLKLQFLEEETTETDR